MKKEEGNNSEIDPNDFSVDEEISRVVELAKKYGKPKKTYLNGKKGQENKKSWRLFMRLIP